jgi:hypothetical protein
MSVGGSCCFFRCRSELVFAGQFLFFLGGHAANQGAGNVVTVEESEFNSNSLISSSGVLPK